MRLLFAFLAATAFLSAQGPAARTVAPAFEAATVKPHSDPTAGRSAAGAPDRFYRPFITLANLVNYAWDMRPYRILGGPDWMRTDTWEVTAKADRDPGAAGMRLMVRRLLEERFKLAWHIETRELPVYTLVLARSDGRLGPNLKPAEFDCRPYVGATRPAEPPPTNPATGRRRCLTGFTMGGGTRTITIDGVPVSRLADTLSVDVQRQIVDKTGLTGVYDIELKFLDEAPPPGFAARPGTEPNAAALLTAIQEQLGLKLEPSRGPVEVIVIDSAQRPTPD